MSNDDRNQPRGFSISRRKLLASTAASVGSAAVGAFGFNRLAFADIPPPAGRSFIFCYFPGGWDQVLFLDPRDPAVFNEENSSRTGIQTRYSDLAGFSGFSDNLVRPAGAPTNFMFGPAAQKLTEDPARGLMSFADKMSIVRGINMNTLGHEVGYRYFLTGRFPSGNTARGTNVSAEIVGQMAPRRPLPNLSLRVESYNDRQPGSASAIRVDNINDLLLLLGPSQYGERDATERALVDFGQRVGPCGSEAADRRGLLSAMRASRSQADQIVRERLANRFEFATGLDDASREIRRIYNFALGDVGAPGARAAAAAQAIKSGMTQVASLNIGVGTDTHFVGNQGHAPLLYQGVSALVALLNDLRSSTHPEGGTFLDHTTLMCFSEFSRTPMFNNFGGRDHHLTGSCLLVGAGIRGRTVVGASSDVGMVPMKWNIRDNRPADNTSAGENIQPEHVAATLLASAGLDYSITRVQPLQAALAPR